MFFKSCLCLVVAIAVVQCVPTGKLEKISESSAIAPKELEDLDLEDTSADKERLKKQASFLVEIRPGSENGQQGSQDGCQGQVQGQVQSLNVVQQSPAAPQVQTYSIQQAAQPMQTVGVFPAPQLATQTYIVPQQSYMMPQQVVPQQQLVHQQVIPSVQTLQIIQPQQPCASESKVQVIEKKIEVPAPAPAPKPAPEVVDVKPQPERIVVPKTQIVETVKLVPVPPVCKEKLMVVPSKPMVVVPQPTVVKVPHCTHEGQELVSQCSCNQQAMRAAAMGPVDPMHMMAMRARHMPHMRSDIHFVKDVKV
ncbi:uncharacterized protein LOC143358543 [Halictus rubicundus]|uniref:uncharacterized protein LOC143358543 n=1 Tax=Halictus rubicundus TaxID=77578 RepID=UPI004036869B